MFSRIGEKLTPVFASSAIARWYKSTKPLALLLWHYSFGEGMPNFSARAPAVGQVGGITGKQSARFLKNSQNPWVLFEILFLVRCVAARIHARFSPIRSPYVTCSPNEKVDAQRRVQVRGTQCNS
jgi:hypothetical protein